MNTKLVILFALVNLVFAQYGPEFDGGAIPPTEDGEGYAAAQPDFEGENAEVPFESTQEGAFEGGEYGAPGMQAGPGMLGPNEQMQQGPYQGQISSAYNPASYPEETMHRPKFMPFRK